MGDVIRFPQERCSLDTDLRAEPALVLVLPVICVDRIELVDRPPGTPIGGLMSGLPDYEPLMSAKTARQVAEMIDGLRNL